LTGTHLTLIGMGLMKLLNKAGAGVKAASVISGAVMILYGIFTGSSVSTMRAVIMFLLCVTAKIIGRTYDMLSALAFSGILILAENPGYLYHSGFLLSYSAVAGIGILTPAIEKQPKKKGKFSEIQKGLTGGIAVFLAQFPLLQYFFYEIPLFSLAVNLLVIPLLPIIVISGFLGLMSGIMVPALGKVLLSGACFLLQMYEKIGCIIQKMPVSSLITGQPALWQVGAYYMILALFLAVRGKSSRKLFFGGILFASVLLSLRPGHGFRAVMLDVGQGDCLALETPGDHFFLIDGGSSSVQQVGTYRILPFIKQRGVGEIEGIFVTHGDEDHISGVLEILEGMKKGGGVKVKKLFLPMWMKNQEDQRLQEKARQAKVPVGYLQKGDKIQDKDVIFHILYPDGEETGEDGNSGSLTMRVEYGALSFLLTGDLTGEGEKKVTREKIGSQILKVAHHGSGSSTDEEFLTKASPSFALISCGRNNRYGHPAPELIQRLEERNIVIYDTRRDGAVSFMCDAKGRLKIETFL
jgi:competence protein ComEC